MPPLKKPALIIGITATWATSQSAMPQVKPFTTGVPGRNL
jgi:hypothetical protein